MSEIKVDAPETVVSEEDNAPKYTSMMAVHHALHAEPVEFEKSVTGLLADRVQNAVEKHREEVANSIFGNPNETPEANAEDETESGTEETSELEPVEDDETPSEE